MTSSTSAPHCLGGRLPSISLTRLTAQEQHCPGHTLFHFLEVGENWLTELGAQLLRGSAIATRGLPKRLLLKARGSARPAQGVAAIS